MCFPTLLRSYSEQLQKKSSPDFQLGLPLVWSAESLAIYKYPIPYGDKVDLGHGAEVAGGSLTSHYTFAFLGPSDMWMYVQSNLEISAGTQTFLNASVGFLLSYAAI